MNVANSMYIEKSINELGDVIWRDKKGPWKKIPECGIEFSFLVMLKQQYGRNSNATRFDAEFYRNCKYLAFFLLYPYCLLILPTDLRAESSIGERMI